MKKIALTALAAAALIPSSAHASGFFDFPWWEWSEHHPRTVSAPEMPAGLATFAAALIGFAGYMLLRRLYAESK
jgi:hypothetical protein